MQPIRFKIRAVKSDSKKDLAILIDNAASQCSINSIFKDPVDSSTVTETIQSPVNSDEIIQQWFLAKNPDGTYQKLAVAKVYKSKTIGNTKKKTSIVTSQINIEVHDNNPQPEPTVLNAVEPKPTSFLKCYAKNCINSGKLLCNQCKAVQYCSDRCQLFDFYDCHRYECQQLENIII